MQNAHICRLEEQETDQRHTDTAHTDTHTLRQEESAALPSASQCQGHVGVCQEAGCGRIKGCGVQASPLGCCGCCCAGCVLVVMGSNSAPCHRGGRAGSLLALVLLKAGIIAALSPTAGTHDALAGREPASTLDVPIYLGVGALHARLAVHGDFCGRCGGLGGGGWRGL